MRNLRSTLSIFSLLVLTACNGGGASAVSLSPSVASPFATTNTAAPGCDPNAIPFGGGDGSSASPYLVCVTSQLLAINGFSNSKATFLLTADIDNNGVAIAASEAILPAFAGTLDGGGHAITGIRTNSQSAMNAGFIGENSGTVKNLTLANVSISGATNVGAVAGINWGTITNVMVSGSVPSSNGAGNVGGVVGLNQGGTITNVQTDLIVTGNNSVGGIAGEFRGGTVSNVTVTGSVNGSFNVGGGFGYNDIDVGDGGTGAGSINSVQIKSTYQSGQGQAGCMNGYLDPVQPTVSGNSC